MITWRVIITPGNRQTLRVVFTDMDLKRLWRGPFHTKTVPMRDNIDLKQH